MGARPNVSPKREEANVELDVSQEIGQILDEFATRFGATGAELWAELVRYEVYSAVADAVISPMMLVLGGVTLWWGLKKYEETSADGWGVAIIGGGIAFVIGIICTFVSAWTLFVTLAAPQAATLKGLLP